ncbi:hypothetical protein LCGC14_1886610 [marine sediment metagenome]|uniref:Uncharacterized protein n=1 Tax=marine sediment metagenome TaxID=412755 RepID=A0A0F9G0X2_9ZZZZ
MSVAEGQCKHPPTRLYSYWAADDDGVPDSVLVISCLDCHEILKGRALTTEETREPKETCHE